MRYLPLSDGDREEMLARIGVAAIDDLFADVPAEALLRAPLDLPRRKGELEVERILSRMADRNVPASSVPFFVGAGAYKHHVPASVDHLIQRSEFLTSYTPYQPEIAQGTLQYLFEFQTQVANLTAMEVANASMYDGSTGTAEAVLMAHRITRRRKAVLSGGLHPHYADVVATLTRMANDEVVTLAPDVRGSEDLAAAIDDSVSCVVVQSPDVFGNLRDLSPVAEAAHRHGALADRGVHGSGFARSRDAARRAWAPTSSSARASRSATRCRSAGLMSACSRRGRSSCGRCRGACAARPTDADGKRGFVLTLSTREQHIRRDKATSNICTNSGLCCLAFTIHMTLLGEAGLKRLARVNHANAVKLAERLSDVKGAAVVNETFFNEFTLRLPRPAAEVVEDLAARGILAGVPVSRLLPEAGLDDLLLVASTEVNTDEDRAAFVDGLREVLA